jgi:DNA polymerase-1
MSGHGWEDINPNSWQQLKKSFAEMGIKLKSTDIPTFKKNKHRAPDLIEPLLGYKELRNFVTTFGTMWLRHVDSDGRVYASFNQLGTDTGRYSCDSPNLQNIPIRKDDRYRQAFIATDGDWKIITADLSQIEYRIAGEFSMETAIIEEYNKENPDFHQLTANLASQYLGEQLERHIGKTLNFALIYQAYYTKLMDVLGCDKEDARMLYDAYWKGFSGLRSYMKSTGFEARVRGYAETKLGRRRYFITPKNANPYLIGRIEREGGNMPIQGSAADILKLATLYLFPHLVENNARLIHQVHDEIVVESPKKNVEAVTSYINEAFVKAGSDILSLVPTVVNINVGSAWSK